jgi:hypothetical protein
VPLLWKYPRAGILFLFFFYGLWGTFKLSESGGGLLGRVDAGDKNGGGTITKPYQRDGAACEL